MSFKSFPGGSDSKESACSAGDLGSISESGISPREGSDYPLQYSWEFHGQRSRAGYSPWGCKELDTTEYLTLYVFRIEAKLYNILKEILEFIISYYPSSLL